MALSVQQKDAIDKWFKDHKLSPKCALCGTQSWTRDIVATMRATDPTSGAGGIAATGPGLLRMVRLTCGACANVIMLDAARLGV